MNRNVGKRCLLSSMIKIQIYRSPTSRSQEINYQLNKTRQKHTLPPHFRLQSIYMKHTVYTQTFIPPCDSDMVSAPACLWYTSNIRRPPLGSSSKPSTYFLPSSNKIIIPYQTNGHLEPCERQIIIIIKRIVKQRGKNNNKWINHMISPTTAL